MAVAETRGPAAGQKEARYGRFGLWLGVAIAIAFHLALFAVPTPRFLQKSEDQTQRGIIARTYRPQPLASPGAGTGSSARAARPSEEHGGRLEAAPQADLAPVRESRAQVGLAPENAVGEDTASAGKTRGGEQVGLEGGAYKKGEHDDAQSQVATGLGHTGPGGRGIGHDIGAGASDGIGADNAARPTTETKTATDWDRMLALLENKREELSTRETMMRAEREKQTQVASKKTTGVAKEAEEGFLDSRIRINVVSYPSTTIERNFPAIRYPDLRFKRNQMEAGICRVYLRVWTDSAGRITRTELKTPTTRAEEVKYEPFITAVKTGVAEWPFQQTETQVHVDVLFEIQ